MRSLASAELLEVDIDFVDQWFANLDEEAGDEIPGPSRINGG